MTVYFLLVLVYPLLEEWVFRGTLQPALKKSAPFRKQFFSITLANLVTSVIFSALHLFNHSVLWALAVFFPSLVFGWAMDRFKQLAAPVVLHVFYNAGYFLLF
ncbi:MAG: JDVT-CTERM system CAAX-type protease [Gammaproteobacteria bacterium]|nr:JDVT-CTERM system CAAX-type protease [Gammaproteobacteria bacterium]